MSDERVPGRIPKRAGIALIVVGTLLGMLGTGLSWQGEDAGLVLDLVATIAGAGGVLLFWRSRQYAAKATLPTILADSKPDVLYLRSFETDRSTLGYVLWAITLGRPITGLSTEEEQLRDVLLPFGDLIAIGKPNEALPSPGAAKLYASDAEWKKVVASQMRSARLVILRAGGSEGLLWELKQAATVLEPKSLLILAFKMQRAKYEDFKKEAERVFKCTFPTPEEVTRHGRVSGIIHFSDNWEPVFLPFRIPFFRRSNYKPYRRIFMYTLRPVFEEHGLEWQPPPVSLLTIAQILVFSVLGLLVLLTASQLDEFPVGSAVALGLVLIALIRVFF